MGSQTPTVVTIVVRVDEPRAPAGKPRRPAVHVVITLTVNTDSNGHIVKVGMARIDRCSAPTGLTSNEMRLTAQAPCMETIVRSGVLGRRPTFVRPSTLTASEP